MRVALFLVLSVPAGLLFLQCIMWFSEFVMRVADLPIP